MSTVAWDGRDIASDSRVYCGDFHKDDFTKLAVHHYEGKKYAIGLIGRVTRALEIRDWFLAGAVKADFPNAKAGEEESGAIVVISQDQALVYENSPFCEPDNAPMAWGSGRLAAMAAMLCGRSASESIAVAKALDSNTGGPVITIKTKGVMG